MSDLERRVDQLEKRTGPKQPIFICFEYEGRPETPPEEWDRLEAEAIEKNPGQQIYFLYPPEVPGRGDTHAKEH
ncbi:MAG: hypothetical protein HY673_13915 [Chloroflexi bacterium]|nr:hypothetical protein [Chloroflexota bacterium]